MIPQPEEISDKQLYRQAKMRVEAKKGFLIHFAAYLSVNIPLVIIWAVTGAGFPWFLFPLGGWGIGLFIHFLSVFVLPAGRISEWEKREIEKEVQRLKRRST
jgi:hypothetical protein